MQRPTHRDLWKSFPMAERKKKNQKERKGGLWKMTPLRKSTKDVDSHRGLEKPSAFPHFRTRPGGDLTQTINSGWVNIARSRWVSFTLSKRSLLPIGFLSCCLEVDTLYLDSSSREIEETRLAEANRKGILLADRVTIEAMKRTTISALVLGLAGYVVDVRHQARWALGARITFHR